MDSLTITRHGKYWAVYEGRELVVITVYLKGARALVERLRKGSELRKEASPSQEDLREECPLCGFWLWSENANFDAGS